MIVHAWEAVGRGLRRRASAACSPSRCGTGTAQTLFLARDRLGVKPLYYALLPDGTLLFGSELKALLAHGGLARELDPFAIEEYFALGYVPEPRTIFAGARKLPPAHTLTIRRGEPLPAPREYWDVRFTPAIAIGAADAQAELVERLRESVRLRLISEVPLGAFLSGGVDSSAVVAMMAGLSDATGQHLLDRLRRSGLRRVAVSRSRSPSATARDHFVDRVESDDFDLDRHARAASTTSRTPTAPRSRPTASASSRAST